MKKIEIMGCGYIGLPTAITFTLAGYEVCGFDVKPEVVKQLNGGKIHIVEPGLQDVRNHHVLEKPAEGWIPINLPSLADAKQMAAQPDIREVHLGRLYEPLPEVPVVARERKGYVARLQDGQPCLDRRRAHADFGGEGLVVHQLPHAPRHKPQERLELPPVPQCENDVHVALDVGGEIVGVEESRRRLLAVEPSKTEVELRIFANAAYCTTFRRNPRQ